MSLQSPVGDLLHDVRLHAEVLHGGVGLRDDLDPVAFLAEAGDDLAGQVGFAGAGVAGQQQALALEAVEHRIRVCVSFQSHGLCTGFASMQGFRYRPSTSSHRYTGVPSGCFLKRGRPRHTSWPFPARPRSPF